MLKAQVLAAEKLNEEAGQSHHKDGDVMVAPEHSSPQVPQIENKTETSDTGLISVPEKPLPPPPRSSSAASAADGGIPDPTLQKNEIIINETERLRSVPFLYNYVVDGIAP